MKKNTASEPRYRRRDRTQPVGQPAAAGEAAADVLQLEDEGAEDGRDAEQEREPRRRLPVEAQEDAGRDGGPRTAQAGRDGQSLEAAHHESVRRPHLVELRRLPVDPAQGEIGAPQEQAGDYQEDAHRQGAGEQALEEVGEEESGERRGDGADHQPDKETPPGFDLLTTHATGGHDRDHDVASRPG